MAAKPVLEPAPLALRQACLGPVALPSGRDLEQAEVERSWTEDRSRLLRCADTKAALQGYYQHRDAGIAP